MSADSPLNTFVIRFWHRTTTDGSEWVGQIRHVQSEKSRVFSDYTTMQDFIFEFGVVLASKYSLIYLEAIFSAMNKVEMFVAEMKFEQFKDGIYANETVVRAIEVISEATKCLPIKIRDRFPDIPWLVLAGINSDLRNDYENVNLQKLWQLAKHDFPNLKYKIEQIIREVNNISI